MLKPHPRTLALITAAFLSTVSIVAIPATANTGDICTNISGWMAEPTKIAQDPNGGPVMTKCSAACEELFGMCTYVCTLAGSACRASHALPCVQDVDLFLGCEHAGPCPGDVRILCEGLPPASD